jgi:hypothetical protein
MNIDNGKKRCKNSLRPNHINMLLWENQEKRLRRKICLYNRQVSVGWFVIIFLKSLLDCRRCKNRVSLQHKTYSLTLTSYILINLLINKWKSELRCNVYTFHKFHRNAWTYVLYLLYWFSCLSETGCWQNITDSEGLDFVLQTDQ